MQKIPDLCTWWIFWVPNVACRTKEYFKLNSYFLENFIYRRVGMQKYYSEWWFYRNNKISLKKWLIRNSASLRWFLHEFVLFCGWHFRYFLVRGSQSLNERYILKYDVWKRLHHQVKKIEFILPIQIDFKLIFILVTDF